MTTNTNASKTTLARRLVRAVSALALLLAAASAAGAAALALALPVSALADDTYVDRSDGHDAGNGCHNRAKPCATIARGIARAGPGDVVFVGGDRAEYTQPLDLGEGKSIVRRDFSRKRSIHTAGRAVIDTGSAGEPAIEVISRAGRIKGLTVRSEFRPILLTGPATVTQDRFIHYPDVPGAAVVVAPTAIATQIVDNTFVDPDPATAAQGISAASGALPRIIDNEFDDIAQAINVTDGFISGNDIAGTTRGGFGIRTISGAGATLTANRLHNPSLEGAGTAFGVFTNVPTQFERNLIKGYDEGVRVQDDPGPVTFQSDAILNSRTDGVSLNDTGADDPGVSDATATNITLMGSQGFFEGGITAAVFTIDSSIVGDGGLGAFGGGTCVITHSRGPTQTPGGSGCDDYQTIASPRLKADGYHLKAASPLIDLGNPEKPSDGSRDIDGDRRALDGPDGGNCKGRARRDIGADEYRCA
jgi:hypothetical protein